MSEYECHAQKCLCTGYLVLFASQATCREFSVCYNDVNICLWTDGSQLTQSAAETACQQRNNYFLPRITNSNIQEKLATFRSTAHYLLGSSGFWIDVKIVGISPQFHWIDNSLLAGMFACVPGKVFSCCITLFITYL